MGYTVHQVAEITGLSPHTLRYYDRQGIMPFLKKGANGAREFSDYDLQWIQVIECMKVSGFTLAEMRDYADLVRQGDATLEDRLAMFEEHRERTKRAIRELEASLDGIEYKCWYYRIAVEAGTERVHLTGEGYDQALCYRRFKEWEEHQLGHRSELWTLFPEPKAAPEAEAEPKLELESETTAAESVSHA